MAEVAKRLGASTRSLYVWIKRYRKSAEQREQDSAGATELRRLRSQVKRLTEERDILKKPSRTMPRSPAKVRVYSASLDSIRCAKWLTFIPAVITPSGVTLIASAIMKQRLLGLVEPSWVDRGRAYG